MRGQRGGMTVIHPKSKPADAASPSGIMELRMVQQTISSAAQTRLKSKSHRVGALARLLSVGTALTLLMSAGAAQAQEATPYSFGDMLASNGGPLTLPLGITATTEIVALGTGVAGNNMGVTNASPAFMGGFFNPGDTGWDEANRTIGIPEDMTRIHVTAATSVTSGATTEYANAVGFKVSFSSPIPVDYFYAVDLDFDEWKTSFGIDPSGNLVTPAHDISASANLETITPAIANTGWEADLGLPAGTIPANLTLTYNTPTVNVGPDDHDSQLIFDYNNQSLSEIYFFYGRTDVVPRGQGNSGVSALFLGTPAMDVTKNATAAALQPDGTFDITYELLIENTGSAPFDSLSLLDDLAASGNLGSAFNSVSPAGVTITPVVSTGGSDFPAANPAFDGDGAAGDAELIDQTDPFRFEPGDSFTVSFTANADAGPAAVSLPNSAVANAVPAGFVGSLLVESSDNDDDDSNGTNPTVIVSPVASPALALTKAADDNTDRTVGETITYTYTATNTGNINIADVTVSDVHSGTGTLGAITIDTLTNTSGNSSDDGADNDIDLLFPGDSVTFTASYVVTAADANTGADITNTATAAGVPAAGDLTSPTASETVTVPLMLSLPTEIPQIPAQLIPRPSSINAARNGVQTALIPLHRIQLTPRSFLEPTLSLRGQALPASMRTIRKF